MPEIRSALGAAYRPGQHGGDPSAAQLVERLDLDLVQVAAWPDTRAPLAEALAEALGVTLPQDGRTASGDATRAVYQIAPGRYLVTAPRGEGLFEKLSAVIGGDLGAVTELGHARSILELRGPASPAILARGFALDLDDAQFPAQVFAQTNVHHIGVLLHRLAEEGSAYRILVLRTFARSFWEWLFETAEVFGCEVAEPKR